MNTSTNLLTLFGIAVEVKSLTPGMFFVFIEYSSLCLIVLVIDVADLKFCSNKGYFTDSFVK